MQNPFLLVFGRSPLESVSRLVQTNEIIEMFVITKIIIIFAMLFIH